MHIPAIPFEVTNWDEVEAKVVAGETGTARSRTRTFSGIRVRFVEYSAGYAADHWCNKGHILLCLEGEIHTELQDGRIMVLGARMSYQVGDEMESHRSSSANGAKLFIVD